MRTSLLVSLSNNEDLSEIVLLVFSLTSPNGRRSPNRPSSSHCLADMVNAAIRGE